MKRRTRLVLCLALACIMMLCACGQTSAQTAPAPTPEPTAEPTPTSAAVTPAPTETVQTPAPTAAPAPTANTAPAPVPNQAAAVPVSNVTVVPDWILENAFNTALEIRSAEGTNNVASNANMGVAQAIDSTLNELEQLAGTRITVAVDITPVMQELGLDEDEQTISERKELLDDVERLMEKVLSPSQRKIIELHEYEGQSYEEVAAQMGMQQAAVRMQISRARKALREEYRKRNATSKQRRATAKNSC